MNRQPPARYRDILPQPLAPLPPTPQLHENSTSEPELPVSNSRQTAGSKLQTLPNAFGLIRQYFSDRLPSHDPEEYVDVIPSDEPFCSNILSSFSPYPNENSFLLGDWYWNHGNQKSQESFRQLLGIVGHPEFRPEDVRRTTWSKIDAKLGSNPFDRGTGEVEEEEWMDEDAGWHRTPITISVPFHNRTKAPGPKNYLVGDLYHRSLVDVIREKLANTSDVRHFHYEPFELLWNRPGMSPDVRVHGELYTSPAFLDAHRKLQESPGEPGCDLPRVVIAMMFWSDATHLTSFGTAKLWPCYLYFGNESKYRRCKPINNLCNHVAYFHIVSSLVYSHTFSKASGSFQMHSKILLPKPEAMPRAAN